MKAITVLIIFVFLASMLTIAGCGEKPQCKSSSECPALNSCFTSRCVDGKCTSKTKDNCCGNNKCELDLGESRCSCSKDCGNCTGKVKYNVTTTRGTKLTDARFAIYSCLEDVCSVLPDPDSVRPLSLINEINERNAFKTGLVMNVKNPYDLLRDDITIEFTLNDINAEVMNRGGVLFTGMQALSGSELMGRTSFNQKLIKVGDVFTEKIALTSSQTTVEEDRLVDIKIDYQYTTLDSKAQPLLVRNYAKIRVAEKMTLVAQ